MKRIVRGIVGTLSVITFSVALSQGANASTGVYIGKDASTDGSVIIAANADCHPGEGVYVEAVARDEHEEADSYQGKSNNFSYEYPDTTYEYKVIKSMDYVNDSSSYAASNEYGVCISAVVSADNNVQSDYADPLAEDGLKLADISEVLASSCKTARNATNLLCDLIDEKGAGDTYIVMIADQREAWYVEVYSGHQYAAIKMPEDKVAVFGDEFMLQGIDIEDPAVIVSKELISLAEDNDFAQYDEDGKLNLARTYGDNKSCDNTARTWVGRCVLAPSDKLKYDEEAYYDLLFDADEKVSVSDVFGLLRNRFEGEELNNQFEDMEIVVPIASDATVESHVMQIYSDMPAEISNVTWVCAGPTLYTPYVPFVGYVDEIATSYSTNQAEDEYREGVASCDYQMLNALCSRDSDGVGAGVKEFWEASEEASIREVAALMAGEWLDAYEEDPDVAKSFIAEYCNDEMEKRVAKAQELFVDGSWHETKNYGSVTVVTEDKATVANCSSDSYSPYFDIVEYANAMGWSSEVTDSTLTFVREDETIVINLDDENATIRKYKDDESEGTVEETIEIENIEDELSNVNYKDTKKASILTKTENLTDEEILSRVLESDASLEGIDMERIYQIILDFLKEEYPDIIDQDLTVEDFEKIIDEASEGISQFMEVYGDIDLDELGIGDFDISDFDINDIEIGDVSMDDFVDAIDSLDADTKNALGEMLGADVDDVIDAYRDGNLEIDVDIDVDTDELGIPEEYIAILEDYFGEKIETPAKKDDKTDEKKSPQDLKQPVEEVEEKPEEVKEVPKDSTLAEEEKTETAIDKTPETELVEDIATMELSDDEAEVASETESEEAAEEATEDAELVSEDETVAIEEDVPKENGDIQAVIAEAESILDESTTEDGIKPVEIEIDDEMTTEEDGISLISEEYDETGDVLESEENVEKSEDELQNIDLDSEDTGNIDIRIKKVGHSFYAPSWAMKMFK